MTPANRAALAASVRKFGFKTFVTVVEGEVPGTFAVVDGHHRWEVAEAEGIDTIPVVLLDKDLQEREVDLAMLSFNVSADIIPEVYVDYLNDVQSAFGADMASQFTGVDRKFLESLSHDCARTLDDLGLGADASDAVGAVHGPQGFTISLPADDAFREQVGDALLRSGLPNLRLLVQQLLSAYVAGLLLTLPEGSQGLVEKACKLTGVDAGEAVALLLHEAIEEDTRC